MQLFDPLELKQLYIPSPSSHKGENGKLLLIGGSHLFHAASLWALNIASRIVDMVFYSSVPENNEIVQQAKTEFRDGIVVRREDLEFYIAEADVVLVGPGMVRADKERIKNQELRVNKIKEINEIADEGEQTYYLTRYLLEKYPQKKWVIDAGALQMIEPEWLKSLGGHVVITPHQGEFKRLTAGILDQEYRLKLESSPTEEQVSVFSREYACIVLLKGQHDIVCSPTECRIIKGGNAGLTKGGTGDVLAGLVAALATKNDLFLSACAGSFINKEAGARLYERVGLYYNASDLVDEIPKVMKELILH